MSTQLLSVGGGGNTESLQKAPMQIRIIWHLVSKSLPKARRVSLSVGDQSKICPLAYWEWQSGWCRVQRTMVPRWSSGEKKNNNRRKTTPATTEVVETYPLSDLCRSGVTIKLGTCQCLSSVCNAFKQEILSNQQGAFYRKSNHCTIIFAREQ